MIDLLQGARVFMTPDLKNKLYKNERIELEIYCFCCFVGYYEFLRVLFDLYNSPAVFQQFINLTF